MREELVGRQRRLTDRGQGKRGRQHDPVKRRGEPQPSVSDELRGLAQPIRSLARSCQAQADAEAAQYEEEVNAVAQHDAEPLQVDHTARDREVQARVASVNPGVPPEDPEYRDRAPAIDGGKASRMPLGLR